MKDMFYGLHLLKVQGNLNANKSKGYLIAVQQVKRMCSLESVDTEAQGAA